MLEVYVYFQSHGILYSSHLNTYGFFFVTIDTFWFLNDVKKYKLSVYETSCVLLTQCPILVFSSQALVSLYLHLICIC